MLIRLLTPLFALFLVSISQAQVIYDAEHNATTLVGTWSSGSRAVRTGAGFANPANKSFTYPKTTGISYSFNNEGYFEIARYRFNGNGSQPTCITGVIGWLHGKYTLEADGSLTMEPLGDGYQQIQDPCAAESNFIEDYNKTELYKQWRIFLDPQTADFKLHLFQFDGAPLAPQFRISEQPNMLPTRLLRNVTPPATFQAQNLLASNIGLDNGVERSAGRTVGLAVGSVMLGLASLML